MHVHDCPACRELLRADTWLAIALGATAADPARERHELLPRFGTIQLTLERERGPRAWLRARSTPVRLAFALGTLFAILVTQMAFGRRLDWHVYPPWRMGLAGGLYLGGVRALLRVHLRPLGLPPLSPAIVPSLSAAFLLVVGAFALGPQAHQAHPASLVGNGSDFVARSTACFGYGVALSAVFAAAVWMLSRETRGGFRYGLAAATATGLAANEPRPARSLRHHLAGPFARGSRGGSPVLARSGCSGRAPLAPRTASRVVFEGSMSLQPLQRIASLADAGAAPWTRSI